MEHERCCRGINNAEGVEGEVVFRLGANHENATNIGPR